MSWHRSPCQGLCERAPAALIFSAGPSPHAQALGPASQEEIEALAAGRPLPPMDLARSVPQLGEPGLTLLSRIGRVDPASLDDYRAAGGYLALRRAFEMGPERVVREVLDAKLVGRGGAAFPTGQKWQGVRSAPSPRYLICNGRRIRAGDLQGSRADGGGPLRPDRGHHHRRLCHGLRAGFPLHPWRVSAGDRAAPPRHRDLLRARLSRPDPPGARRALRPRAAARRGVLTSAARRRRS